MRYIECLVPHAEAILVLDDTEIAEIRLFPGVVACEDGLSQLFGRIDHQFDIPPGLDEAVVDE